jgi:hypothetical protein
MSDVHHLANNSVEDSYVAFIDSSMRDRMRYPSASSFVSEFTVPFTDVFSVDVVDIKVPSTPYTIDGTSNHEFGYRFEDSEDWHILRMPPGYYRTGEQLTEIFNAVMDVQTDPSLPRIFMRTFGSYYRTHVFADQTDNFAVASTGSASTVPVSYGSTQLFASSGASPTLSNYAQTTGLGAQHSNFLVLNPRDTATISQPQFSKSFVNMTQQAKINSQEVWSAGRVDYDFTGRVFFFSDRPFQVSRELTTMHRTVGLESAREVVRSATFADLSRSQDPNVVRLVNLLTLIGVTKLDPAMFQKHFVFPESVVDLQGPRYVHLRCPEIEAQWYRNRAYENYNMGLAVVASSPEQTFSLISTPSRRFHPISKLDRLTFRFETSEGKMIDFNGADVLITLAIRFYRPPEAMFAKATSLNPKYDPDTFKYMTTEVFRDGDSSEEGEEYEAYPGDTRSYAFDRVQRGLG